MSADRLPQLRGSLSPLTRAGRDLSRRLDEVRADSAVEVTQAQADAALAATRIESASRVAEMGMRYIGMAADTEERLLRQHPHPLQAARLAGIVDALADLTRDEITLLSLRSRASGR